MLKEVITLFKDKEKKILSSNKRIEPNCGEGLTAHL